MLKRERRSSRKEEEVKRGNDRVRRTNDIKKSKRKGERVI